MPLRNNQVVQPQPGIGTGSVGLPRPPEIPAADFAGLGTGLADAINPGWREKQALKLYEKQKGIDAKFAVQYLDEQGKATIKLLKATEELKLDLMQKRLPVLQKLQLAASARESAIAAATTQNYVSLLTSDAMLKEQNRTTTLALQTEQKKVAQFRAAQAANLAQGLGLTVQQAANFPAMVQSNPQVAAAYNAIIGYLGPAPVPQGSPATLLTEGGSTNPGYAPDSIAAGVVGGGRLAGQAVSTLAGLAAGSAKNAILGSLSEAGAAGARALTPPFGQTPEAPPTPTAPDPLGGLPEGGDLADFGQQLAALPQSFEQQVSSYAAPSPQAANTKTIGRAVLDSYLALSPAIANSGPLRKAMGIALGAEDGDIHQFIQDGNLSGHQIEMLWHNSAMVAKVASILSQPDELALQGAIAQLQNAKDESGRPDPFSQALLRSVQGYMTLDPQTRQSMSRFYSVISSKTADAATAFSLPTDSAVGRKMLPLMAERDAHMLTAGSLSTVQSARNQATGQIAAAQRLGELQAETIFNGALAGVAPTSLDEYFDAIEINTPKVAPYAKEALARSLGTMVQSFQSRTGDLNTFKALVGDEGPQRLFQVAKYLKGQDPLGVGKLDQTAQALSILSDNVGPAGSGKPYTYEDALQIVGQATGGNTLRTVEGPTSTPNFEITGQLDQISPEAGTQFRSVASQLDDTFQAGINQAALSVLLAPTIEPTQPTPTAPGVTPATPTPTGSDPALIAPSPLTPEAIRGVSQSQAAPSLDVGKLYNGIADPAVQLLNSIPIGIPRVDAGASVRSPVISSGKRAAQEAYTQQLAKPLQDQMGQIGQIASAAPPPQPQPAPKRRVAGQSTQQGAAPNLSLASAQFAGPQVPGQSQQIG